MIEAQPSMIRRMRARHLPWATRAFMVFVCADVLLSAGCTGGAPKTYPVNGRLELSGADLEHLVGSTVEIALLTDPEVRAAGSIQANGSFELESRHGGKRLRGAQAGTHQARIVLADDDREKHARAARSLAPRFRDFKTSNLTIEVPTSGPVLLQVADR